MRNLTLQEAATRLGVSITTVKRWASEGHLEYVVSARGYREYPEAEVERLKRAHEPWQRWSTVRKAS